MADRKEDSSKTQQVTGAEHKESRRKALKSTLIGGAVISASVAPDKWKKPVLDSVVLPAHAATTDDTDSGAPGNTTAAPTAAPTTPEPTTTVDVTTTPRPNGNTAFNFTFSDWVDEQVS